MTTVDLVAIVLWIAVTLYAVFGGADFGAGFWDLAAGGTERGRAPRTLIADAIAPVWEANHTWLIFDLVILWTAFPPAFASIMSTLFIPLTLAGFGIVLRGSAFAFRPVAARLEGRRLAGAVFAASSILTPFFLGAAAGAIASGRVPVGNAAGDPWSSWLTPTSLLVGVLAVVVCAYLAGVFLVSDARRVGSAELERYFRGRAMTAAIVTGALAMAGIAVLAMDAPVLAGELVRRGWPLILASAIFGLAALVQLWRGRTAGARVLAAGAVTAVIWGWGVAQYPYILPGELTLAEAAAPPATLTALLIIFTVALLVIGPSLTLLYLLDQRSRFAGHGVGIDADRSDPGDAGSGASSGGSR
jgi:cytochrome d ubiquinol oxidase subunit II